MTISVSSSYPHAGGAVRKLVTEHLNSTDEPVLLAVYYAPARDPGDIFLLEVFEKFGRDAIDPDRNLFEVSYANRDAFPLAAGQTLHMVMTNAPEFDQAVRENWHHVEELREAMRRGDYEIVHAAPAYGNLRSMLGV